MSDEVLKVLQAGVSQDPTVLKQAEEKLKEWEILPGFYSSLFGILSNRALDASVRWLATITMKNGIERYWRKGAPNGISSAEKTTIRSGLLLLIGEPVNQLATQIAVLIEKIARYDVPHDWTELLPALMSALQNSDDLIQERSLFILHHVIKALASKRLAGDRKAFQEITTQLIGHILEVWNIHMETLVMQIREKHGSIQRTLGKCIICTKVLRKLAVQGVKEPLQDPRIFKFSEVLFERMKTLLHLRKHNLVGTQLDGDTRKLIVGHIKILADLLDRHPFSFLPLIERTLTFVTDYVFTEEGQAYAFEELAVKLMNLMKGVVLCAEYKPAKPIEETKEPATLEAHKIKMEFFKPPMLSQIFHVLVGNYFPLKEEDLNKWSADPEEFLHEEGGESWKYSLRPSTESLFLAIFHEYSTVMCSLLLELVKGNTAFVSPEDIRGILKKDAIYTAIGLASFELFDDIDFDNWFSTSLLQELQCKEPNYRILRRRVVWLMGRWIGVKFSTDLRPIMYEVLMTLMGPQEDLVVRLEAAETLRSAMDDFEFSVEQFLPFLQTSFSQLFLLLKEVNECDTKLHVLNVMSLVIELVGAEIQPYVGGLIQFLPALWEAAEQHNMLRCSIVATLVHIVKGLGGFSIELASFLVPVIHFATDTTQSAHVYLMDDALELWRTLVENSPVCSSELFRLFENLPKALEESSEYLSIGCHIIKAYLYLCPEEFLKIYGDPMISYFNDQIRDMRSEGIVEICKVLELIILCCPSLGSPIVMPLIPFCFNTIYEDSETPLVLGACLSVCSRLLLASRQSFLQGVDALALQLNVTSESTLNRILDVWIEKMSYVSSVEKRKLLAVALASLLTSRSPFHYEYHHGSQTERLSRSLKLLIQVPQYVNESRDMRLVLDKICGILLRLCETVNDVLVRELDGQEIDRLYAVPGQFEPDATGEDYESQPTEHTKRQKKVLTTMDPVHIFSLPDYFKEQMNQLRGQVSPSEFDELMKTVDVETMEMVKEFFSNSNIKANIPISNPMVVNFS